VRFVPILYTYRYRVPQLPERPRKPWLNSEFRVATSSGYPQAEDAAMSAETTTG